MLRLAPSSRTWLLAVARAALRDAMATTASEAIDLPLAAVARPPDPALEHPARVFVSWHASGRLVGCIGTLEPHPCLEAAVGVYAVRAGLHDPRLPPAHPRQWDDLHCEISILEEPRPLRIRGLEDIAARLRPGTDGVILTCGGRRAFFLPQVWRSLPGAEVFLAALCRKAGIDPTSDGPFVEAEVLRAEVFGEPSGWRDDVLP